MPGMIEQIELPEWARDLNSEYFRGIKGVEVAFVHPAVDASAENIVTIYPAYEKRGVTHVLTGFWARVGSNARVWGRSAEEASLIAVAADWGKRNLQR